MVTRVCPTCGKSFDIPQRQVRDVNCCSIPCRADYVRIHPKREKGIERLCACGCGETFFVPSHQPGRIYKKGHGRKQGSYYVPRPRKERTMIDVTCAQCGKQWQVTKGLKQGKNTFCCFQCAMDYRIAQPKKRVIMPCAHCGKECVVLPSDAKRKKHAFCNVTCRKAFIVGPNNPAFVNGRGASFNYGPHWKSQRRAAVIRDGYTCQVCKRKPKSSRLLQVHHITRAFDFTNHVERNQLSNLITLCHVCHRLAEKGKIKIQRKMF